MAGFIKLVCRSVVSTLVSIVVFVLVIAGVVWALTRGGVDVEEDSWVIVDFYGEVKEYDPPGSPMAKVLGGDPLTLTSILDGLDKAALDERVEGVILRLSSTHTAGWAKLQEVRNAIDRMQEAGKPVYAWGDAMDLSMLYLASTCDRIMMPAGGYFDIRGLAAESMHVRNALDKLGVVPHLHKIDDFKSAAEMVMNAELSDSARAMRQWMLDETWDMVVPTILQERGISEERFLELLAYSSFTPEEARRDGLIDELLYWQDLEARLKADDEDLLRTVDVVEYAGVPWEDVGLEGGVTVAVVHAQGTIGGRFNRVDPLFGLMMGHESVVTQLRRARLDDDVKAVVFRVDSGGGESLASDLISREVELLDAAKPVVVSMVDVAASGGYMISYKARNLMADPLSVTGSIGSINGFFNLRGLYDKLGVSKSFVVRGPAATMGSDYRDPTPAEWERHTDAHWIGFNDWMFDVAARREIPEERIAELCLGRVWTGRQAVANGLIDRTGDLHDAVRWAAELAGVEPREPLRTVHLPESKSLLESLFSDDAPDADVASTLSSHAWSVLRGDVSRSLHFAEHGAAGVYRP